jgi:hypothetical protein
MNLSPVGYTRDATLYGGMGLQWVDGETIGRLLYPEADSPSKRIRNIFLRNSEHFSESDTVLLKVDSEHYLPPQFEAAGLPKEGGPEVIATVTPGQSKKVTQKREVRFFSVPDGLMKICHFSRSKNALAVQQRMIDMWKAFLAGTLPKPEPTLAAIAPMRKWSREKGALRKQIALAEGVGINTIRRREARVLAGEPIRKPRPKGRKAIHKKHRDKYDEAMRLRSEGLTLQKIEEITGVPHQTVGKWTQAQKEAINDAI